MKFIPSRDLRIRPGEVWKKLKTERELIVTSHGHPVALMVPVDEKNIEESLTNLRRVRAKTAIKNMQEQAAKNGLDKLTMAEIDEIIHQTRMDRRK